VLGCHGFPSQTILFVSKFTRRLLLLPVILFLGLELFLWIFVRIPVEPLKRLDLVNTLPGLKPEVRLSLDRNLVRYLDEASGEKPAGTQRILCLGGSATFAILQNADDTWWGQLGRQLQAKGLPVQVAAWGQDRTGIVASTPLAATLMEDWQPDLVIANFGFDDVVGQPLDYRYVPEKAQGLPGPPRTAGWKQALLQISQTARFFRWWTRRNENAEIQGRFGRTDYLKNTFAAARDQANGLAIQPVPERDPTHDPLMEFLDGWKVLQELCHRHGARLVLTGEASLHDSTNNLTQQENLIALIPLTSETGPKATFRRPDPAWVERQMDRYAAAVEAMAKSAGLPWLNLNGRVPRDLDHFFNDVILTDKGAAVVARELLPVVEPLLRQGPIP
jgi:hypothetical protein